PQWVAVPDVRGAAVVLLLLTAWLATLRALGRRLVAASLRWLLVSDGALAAVLVASRAVREDVIFLLWAGAFGGRAFLLAGEMRSAAARRGPQLAWLWRLAIWTASGSLAWPLLTALGTPPYTRNRLLEYLFVAVPVALGSLVTVARLVPAPERRAVGRRHFAFSLAHVAATLTFAIGPTALTIAWSSGFTPARLPALLAAAPALLGAAVALFGAGFLLLHDRARNGTLYALAPLVVLTPLAALVAYGGRDHPGWAAIAAVLVAALLAREREDAFASECALKLVWVLGGSLALSWAGLGLLTLATGTSRVSEQWAVLRLGLDPPQLWSAAL